MDLKQQAQRGAFKLLKFILSLREPGSAATAEHEAVARQLLKATRDLARGRISGAAGDPRRDLSAADLLIVDQVTPYTATSVERLVALIGAVRYVVQAKIPGAIAECGVWRGGSMMAIAKTLMAEGELDRDLYLYDTFEGMTAPTDIDRSYDGMQAAALMSREPGGTWCYSSLEEVRANMAKTGYPASRLHFIQGKVEDTIPRESPGPLALLRLDTDWYESTRHELEHLFPLLQDRGALIIDDYGHWQGARQAVDEFLRAQPRSYYLHRIDYSARLIIKA